MSTDIKTWQRRMQDQGHSWIACGDLQSMCKDAEIAELRAALEASKGKNAELLHVIMLRDSETQRAIAALPEAVQAVRLAVETNDGDTLRCLDGDDKVIWVASGSWSPDAVVTLGHLRTIAAASNPLLDAATQAPSAPVAPSAEDYSDMLREFFFRHAAGGYNDDGGLVPLEKCRSKLDWIVEDQRANLAWQARAALSVKAGAKPAEVVSTGQRADDVERQLVVGKFYWIWIALDPDANHEWENDFMPARFAGYANNGNEMWNCLDPDPDEWPSRCTYHLATPTPPTTGEAVRIIGDSTVSVTFPTTRTDAERSQVIIDRVFPSAKGKE